jgi:hypothetical protein
MLDVANALGLLTPDEAAKLLHSTRATLASWRSRRIGPNFLRLAVGQGRKILYRMEDIQRFLDSRVVRTSGDVCGIVQK